MRRFAALPLALLAAGCLAPGVPDPTRYPWDRPKSKYCIVSLELPNSSGISTSPQAMHLACAAQPNRAPHRYPPRRRR